jgi:hypothetical protein
MYVVHMKRVTASDARKNWFRLLDEVAAGEVVCIERGGRTIVIRRQEGASEAVEIPDYGAILRVPDVEDADRWGWEWSPDGGGLESVDRPGPPEETEPHGQDPTDG